MNFSQRLKFIWQSLFANQPEEFPAGQLPNAGRVSAETNGNYLSQFNNKYGYINPIFDTELLQTIENLALFNPDFTQFVNQMISLGNQGHKTSVTAKTSQQIEAVITRINERAANLYKSGAGVSGLLNAYGRQLAEAGAVSSEDVVDLRARCVSKVVIVPTRQIRFRYNAELDEYFPVQIATGTIRGSGGNLIELNTLTYCYFPWVTPQNSPYAIPPGLGAVETLINSQAKILEAVPQIANKKSLLGLLSIMVNPLRQQRDEIDAEYTARQNAYLDKWKTALSGNLSNGLLLAFKGTDVQHTQTTGDSQGFAEIHQISEEQIFSGMNVPASLMGRSYAVAETWAEVVYEAYKGYNKNLWMPAKHRHERTLRLDCRLAGLQFESINLTFDKMPTLKPQDEAKAEKANTETALLKARSGMISPDAAAMESGYDNFFDANLLNSSLTSGQNSANSLSATLIWDDDSQSYKLERERLTILQNDEVLGDLTKKNESLRLSEEQINEILDHFIEKYLNVINGYLNAGVAGVLDRLRRFLETERHGNFSSAEDFATKLVEKLSESWNANWSTSRAVQSIKNTTKSIYQFFRTVDTTPFGGESPVRLRFGGPDLVSVEFFGNLEHFYLSRFGGNTDKDLRAFLQKEYLEKGAGLFGRETSDSLNDFRQAVGEKFKNLTDRQINTIVTSAVQRIRNWGHIGSLAQGGIELARIVATVDNRTTEICLGLDGKLIRVGVAQKTIERLNQLEPGEFDKEMYQSKIGKAISKNPVETISKWIEADGKTIGDQIIETGRGFPPYHPNCRTILEALTLGIDEEVK